MHIPTIPTPDPDHLQTLLDRHTAAAVVGRVGLGKTGLLRALEARWEGPVFRVHYNRAEAGTDYSGIDVLLASLGAPSIEDAAAVPDAVLSALRAAELPDDGLIVILGADKMDRPSQDVLGQDIQGAQFMGTRLVRGRLYSHGLRPDVTPCGLSSLLRRGQDQLRPQRRVAARRSQVPS